MPRRTSSRYARRGADDKESKTEGSFMKRLISLTAVVAAAAFVVAATAVAAPVGNKTQLYSKDIGPHGTAFKCFPDTPGTPTNGWTFVDSFDTQADCEAAAAGGGGEETFTATACND